MKRLIRLVIIIFFPVAMFGQVLTTASVNGRVSNTDDLSLEGANVVAKHVTSGTTSGATTRSDGSFNIPNLRVGGPYSIMVSYIGYSNSHN